MMNSSKKQTTDNTAPQNSQLWRTAILFVLMAAVFGLAIYFAVRPETLSKLDDILTVWISDAGPWGWFLVIFLMVLHSFVPLPAEFVAMAAGMSYDFVLAVFLVWLGAMLGAIVAFGLARWLGQPFVERILPQKYQKSLQNWRENQSVPALLISRFIPLISFNLINYAAGLTGVTWWTFLWTTAVGILPITFLSVYIGAKMGELSQNWIIGLSAIAISLILLAHWWFRRQATISKK